MKNVDILKGWVLDKNFTDDQRFADVSIHFSYPEINSILDLNPVERKKSIGQDQKHKLNELLSACLLKEYQIIGSRRSPRGVKATIDLKTLEKVSFLDYIQIITINHVSHAKKLKQASNPTLQFYCVKMTVAIEIEGRSSGLQSIEERLVLIKANSDEDAYNKLEERKDSYAVPYLNTDGQLVRWRIESFDDCYSTDISNIQDFDNPEGVEVYSKLKNRRLKKTNIWDGK